MSVTNTKYRTGNREFRLDEGRPFYANQPRVLHPVSSVGAITTANEFTTANLKTGDLLPVLLPGGGVQLFIRNEENTRWLPLHGNSYGIGADHSGIDRRTELHWQAGVGGRPKLNASVADAEAPASPVPTTMMSYFRLLAGLTSFSSNRCRSHVSASGPLGTFPSSSMVFPLLPHVTTYM